VIPKRAPLQQQAARVVEPVIPKRTPVQQAARAVEGTNLLVIPVDLEPAGLMMISLGMVARVNRMMVRISPNLKS
jgi:hypothetical protein